jgi:superoxide reductase
MAERLQIYKCEVCGNIVEVLHGGKGQLVCCGQPMNLLEEQTADFATEKHVPVAENIETGTHVVVGSTLHPMEDSHHIEWIQIALNDGTTVRKFLSPGNTPDADFCENFDAAKAGQIREYCNVHGLWKA